MNALSTIRHALKKELPKARVKIDQPKNRRLGTWWMDARLGDNAISIEWRPRRGFGISSATTESYGEGSDEVFRDASRAARRAIELLRTGEKTSSARELDIQSLREERKVSQEQVAAVLRVKQSAVSKAERRGDMRVSTLRKLIGALGGQLEIVAQFPDGTSKPLLKAK